VQSQIVMDQLKPTPPSRPETSWKTFCFKPRFIWEPRFSWCLWPVRAGLGSVLGYLAAGILLGPVFGLAGAETADLQHFAEFGVVLMLFLIGLELEPRTLWDMRHKLLGLGGAQVALTTLALALTLAGLHQSLSAAVTGGMLGALSSTAIVLQTLSEKNLMRQPGGRSTFSVLLTQDIAVIPMLALIPLLALPETGRLSDAEASSASPTPRRHGATPAKARRAAVDARAVAARLGGHAADAGHRGGHRAGGHYLSRPIFRFVHAAKLPEMSTFISLLMVLGIAFLMMLVGLSPALGTFVAGVVLANSEFRHQLEADLKPFKGLLLGLFFMTVGVGINFAILARAADGARR
jgi:CPA2 family monovalent cation:H+ antiporter-2